MRELYIARNETFNPGKPDKQIVPESLKTTVVKHSSTNALCFFNIFCKPLQFSLVLYSIQLRNFLLSVLQVATSFFGKKIPCVLKYYYRKVFERIYIPFAT